MPETRGTAVILFVGKSVNNTPKLFRVKETLLKRFDEVTIVAIINSDPADIDAQVYRFGGTSGLFKVAKVLRGLVWAFFEARAKKPDFVYAVNPVAGIVARLLWAASSIPYVYEAHEIFCGVGYKFFRGRWRHFWRNVEKWIVSKARAFVLTDEFRAKFIRRYYRLPAAKLDYLLNVPYRNEAGEVSYPLPQRERFKFAFSYCGGVTPARSIENIVEAFSQLSGDQTALYLIGDVEKGYRKTLEDLAAKTGVSDRVFFTGKVTNKELRSALRLTDCTLAFYENKFLNDRMCSPNKIFDALEANVGLICSKSFLTQSVVNKTGFGVTVKDSSTASIKAAMEKAFAMPKPNVCENNWNWESEEPKLLARVDQIFKKA